MRRIKAFQSTAASRRPEDAATVQALKQQLAEYRGGLTSAQSRLRDLESELRGVREENAWLRRLEDELHQGNPDLARAVDSSLARERAQQEIRNARVLELMAEKDHALRAAEQQARTAEQDARRYEGLVGSLRLELDAAEARAGDALAAKADLQAQLDRLVAELTADNAKWRGEAAEWKGQADRMREQVRATVATEHAQQIKELQAALAATQDDLEATKKGRAQAGSDPMVPRSTVAAYQNLAEGGPLVSRPRPRPVTPTAWPTRRWIYPRSGPGSPSSRPPLRPGRGRRRVAGMMGTRTRGRWRAGCRPWKRSCGR